MDFKQVEEVVLKFVDVKGLAEEIAKIAVKPALLSLKAKIDSGEIDIIKNTDMDKVVLDKVFDLILEHI